MYRIMLYSNGCPNCKRLKKQLENNEIQYEEFTDKQKMLDMGIDKLPILEVNGIRMNYKEAFDWANKRYGE